MYMLDGDCRGMCSQAVLVLTGQSARAPQFRATREGRLGIMVRKTGRGLRRSWLFRAKRVCFPCCGAQQSTFPACKVVNNRPWSNPYRHRNSPICQQAVRAVAWFAAVVLMASWSPLSYLSNSVNPSPIFSPRTTKFDATDSPYPGSTVWSSPPHYSHDDGFAEASRSVIAVYVGEK
jgi:hypothetical protein